MERQFGMLHSCTLSSRQFCARDCLTVGVASTRYSQRSLRGDQMRRKCLLCWLRLLQHLWVSPTFGTHFFSDPCLKLYMALDAYVNNSETVAWNYNSSTVARVYHGHLDELKRIELKKVTSYREILWKIFSNCVYVPLPFLVSQRLTKILVEALLVALPPVVKRRITRTFQNPSQIKLNL